MPLSKTGNKVLKSMKKTYKNPKKAKEVFYASINARKPGANKWEGKAAKQRKTKKRTRGWIM